MKKSEAKSPAAPQPKNHLQEPSPKVPLEQQIKDASDHLVALMSRWDASAAKLNTDGVTTQFPQCMLRSANEILAADRVLKNAANMVKDRLLDWREAGGSFEIGRVALKFSEAGKRNPAWKQVAIQQAQKLAAVACVEFNMVSFVEGVLAASPKTETTTVELIVQE